MGKRQQEKLSAPMLQWRRVRFFVFGERTYTVACIRQYVALTVQPMTFPGNAVQRDFPGNGVVLPN